MLDFPRLKETFPSQAAGLLIDFGIDVSGERSFSFKMLIQEAQTVYESQQVFVEHVSQPEISE
jgi:hypothetical protein